MFDKNYICLSLSIYAYIIDIMKRNGGGKYRVRKIQINKIKIDKKKIYY